MKFVEIKFENGQVINLEVVEEEDSVLTCVDDDGQEVVIDFWVED